VSDNILTRGVGTCLRVGGQSTGILRKNPYFEAILVKFQQKWGAVAPLFPTPLLTARI